MQHSCAWNGTSYERRSVFHSVDLVLSGAVFMAVVFGHARWRVSILGVAGLCLGLLMIWQSSDMLDPAWHTDASRQAWMNYLPPVLRTMLMFGLGVMLLVIGVANLWAVLRRRPALIVDENGITHCPILQGRRTTPWNDITHIADGNASLLLQRANKIPLVIGYDWFDGTQHEIKSAIEGQWRKGGLSAT